MSTRDLFVKNAKAQLEEWSEELDRLEGQLRPDTAGARAELDKRTAELRRMRAAVMDELRTIERSGEISWEDHKIGAERALTDMQEALASARAGAR